LTLGVAAFLIGDFAFFATLFFFAGDFAAGFLSSSSEAAGVFGALAFGVAGTSGVLPSSLSLMIFLLLMT